MLFSNPLCIVLAARVAMRPVFLALLCLLPLGAGAHFRFLNSTTTRLAKSIAELQATADYWIWAGHAIPELDRPMRLYVHQLTVEPLRRSAGAGSSSAGSASIGTESFILRRQGLGAIPLANAQVYLTYRLEQLIDPAIIAGQFKSDCEHWTLRGSVVSGIQIDFDSPSKKLNRYADFLTSLRRLLPTGTALSVTGLADWAASAAGEDISRLQLSVDEIVFQLYEGRSPVPSIEQYALAISRTKLPFRIGVLPEQIPSLPAVLRSAPGFQGLVIFKVPV